MMKNKAKHKGKQLLEKPDEKNLEKEIEDLIDREKTKRNIVRKLLGKPNIKIKKSAN